MSVPTRMKALALAATSSAMLLLGAASPAAAAPAAPTAPTAPAAGVQPAGVGSGAGTFRIHNYNASGRCIGIANGLAGNWTCTTNADQTWHWGTTNSAGFRRLVNGNGKCLAVNGGSTANGARILGYSCTGTADQYWAPGVVSGSIIYLVNYKSGKIVGVQGGSKANGAALVQWPAQGHPDQYWY